MNTPFGRTEIEAVFGNPANADGHADAAWEINNIQKVHPPAGWQLYYHGDHGLVKVSGIDIHKLLAESFTSVLSEIWERAKAEAGAGATDEQIRAWLHQERLDRHGGGHEFRKITAGTDLSLHAYGIAIDWDPAHNPRGNPMQKTLPDWWYDIWNNHGWSDGREFNTSDPMHVQFAAGA